MLSRAPQGPHMAAANMAAANTTQDSSFWLSSPLVTSGTATSSCSGCLRTAGAVDIVLGSHNELHVLSVAAGGRLETVFKQPLFCRVKQLSVLPFSLLQPSNAQTQVLDHLLLLLEGGALMVLKYSQLVQRFYIAAEAQLATGSPAESDSLGARMAVSPQPTGAGITVAVAAKRGRIACLTASLDADGSAQLSTPVLYALPAPQILGASYQLMKQRELELGNVMDLVVLPAVGVAHVQQQQQPEMEHIAVLSHKPDESASELVMFGWSADKQQLRKLGSVPLYNHIDAAGFGMPLRVSAVPKCPTAVVITREWGLLLLECSTLLQQQKGLQVRSGHSSCTVWWGHVECCSMECTQQLAFRFQEQQLPHQQWTHRHHVHCFAAKCVVPSHKQVEAAVERVLQAAAPAADAEAATLAAHPTAADEHNAAVLTHGAAAVALQDGAAAGVAAPEAMDMLPEAAVAAAADPAAGHDIDRGIAWAGQQDALQGGAHAAWQAAAVGWDGGQQAGGRPFPLEAAELYDPAAEQPGMDTDDMLVDYETEEMAGAAPSEPDDAYLDADAEASAAAAESGSGVTSSSGSGDEGSPGFEGRQGTSWPASSEERASVIEATSITAVAWASSALDCSPAVSSPQHEAGAASAAGAGAVTDQLLVSTSCGCLLQLTVAITPSSGSSSMGTLPTAAAGAAQAPLRAGNSLNITAVEKVYEVSLPNSIHSSRLGPVLMPLPQQQLLLVADEHSQVQLLQRQHKQQISPAAAAAVQQAVQAAGMGAGSMDGSAVDPAAAAAGAGSRGDSPGDASARVNDQHALWPGAAGAAGLAARLKQQHGSSTATPATPAAAEQDGMEMDAAAGAAGAGAGAGAAVADVSGSVRGMAGQPLDLRQVVAALQFQATGDKQLPHGCSNPAAAAAGSSGSAQAAQPATAAAAGSEGCSAHHYAVVSELQLLGKVGAMVALPHAPPPPQQGQGQGQVPGVSQSSLPLLVAARAGHESGLRVVMPAPQAAELSRGPAHMLDGVSGMWPVTASPDSDSSSSEHVAVVFSFAAGASRALSVGVQFQDVTEVLGLQGSAETLLAACVAEGVVAQVTGTGVNLCCLDALLSAGPGQGAGRAWRGSPKSSRSTVSWQKQQQQQQALVQQEQQQGLEGAGDAVRAAPAPAAAAVGCCHVGSSSSSSQAGEQGAAAGGLPAESGPAALCGMQPSRLAVSSSTYDAGAAPMVQDHADPVLPAAAGGGGGDSAGLLQGYSPCTAGSGSSSCSPSMSPQEQHARHWCLPPSSQEHGSTAAAAAVVLGAAAAGVVVLYTTTGRLVVLGVTSEQQHRRPQQQRGAAQQPLNLEPLDLNSDSLLQPSPSAAAAGVAGAAATAGGGSSSSGGSTHANASKKRVRRSWGLHEAASIQLEGQVSCLQVCAASAAASPASPGSTGISGSGTAGRYIVFVGRYDGSLQLLILHTAAAAAAGGGTCNIQSLAVFDQQRLLPLQALASSLHDGSSSSSGGGALSHGGGHLTAAAVAVPESCVVLPARQQGSSVAVAAGGAGKGAAAGAAAAGEPLSGVRAAARRGKGAAVAASATAGGPDSSIGNSSTGGGLQFYVSYRTGDVAAYRLDLLSLLQQQQQPISAGQSAAGCGQTAAAAGASSASCLRVLTQLRLPCITQLQLLPQQPEQRQQQRVLAVGSQVWLLEHDSVTQRVTSCDIACEPVIAAAALSLPQTAARVSPSAPHSSIALQAAEGTGLSQHHQQQQQQQQEDQDERQDQTLQAAQHMLAVTPSGELQLSALNPGGPGYSRVQVSTWLPYTTVSHLLQHPGSGLLLAMCSGFTSPFSSSGLAGRDLGAEESSWLQALDPCTGAHMAAYEPCRRGGQWLTCMGLWDTPWRPHGSSVRAASTSMAAEHWLASSADPAAAAAAAYAGGADAPTAGAAAAAAVAAGEGAAGGNRAGWRRPGLGASARWWQRLRHRRTADPDPAGDVDVQREREQQEQQQRRRGSRRGPAAAAAAGAEGSSSGSEHFFQLGSLLKGLDSQLVGSGVAAPKAHSSGRSSQASKAVKQRRGPLVVLGTETFGELDGCSGQVLVLQVMHCSRPGSDSSSTIKAAALQDSAALAVDADAAGCSSMLAGVEAAAAAAGSSSGRWGRVCAALPAPDHSPAPAGSSSTSSGGSWVLQRVARLRMPDAVTAVAAFNKDLLLVATRQVLAVYQLKDDQLSKAAYCFVRAPIVSLSAMPAAAGLAAASGGLGLVLAADTLMGVTAFQVNLHAATGQYALQPVGSHVDVRQASQVLCLPPTLQPPAPAAVMKAAALAQASAGSLLPPAPLTPEQHGRQRTAPRQQQQQHNAPAGPLEHHQQQQQQQQAEVGRRGGSRPAAAAAAAADGERLKQVQQMMEAGLRGLCLDEAGAVVEFGWAQQRNVPARWLHTTACIPLPGKAATGSLQLVGPECWQFGSVSQPRGATQLTQLLPGQPGQQDGLPLHWCGQPTQPARGGAAVVAAAADGSVLHMVRLPVAEGQLLWGLQQLLLRHPLTSNLVLGGRERLLLAEQSQGNVMQGVSAAEGRPAVGITPRQLGMVDAGILRLFLVLPYALQQLLLDSVIAGQGQGSGGGGGGGSPGRQLLLDGLRCRLQLLSG